jgi:hypothetical protein
LVGHFKRKYITDFGVLLGTLAIYFVFVRFYAPKNLALLESDFHPFLFISIIYSAYYGTKHALGASVLLSAVYLGLVYMQVDFQAVESLFLFKFLKLPIHITFTSLMVGEIRQRTWRSQRATKEKLNLSQKVEKDLKSKVNLVEAELTELKKRYATLTHSFESNIEMFDNLEGKDFAEVIDSCSYYLEKECHAHFVKFVKFEGTENEEANDGEKGERELIQKLRQRTKVYTLQDDLQRPQEERLLTHVGVEMVVPLVVDGDLKGYFLLFDMPFLSLNIYNQKKVENIVHLAAIALRNYFKRKDFENSSPLLSPYNILKKESFFEELSDYFESLGEVYKAKKEEVFYAHIRLDWNPHLSQDQKRKFYIVLGHLAKREKMGIAPIGGSEDCSEFFYSFVTSREKKEKVVNRLLALFKTLVPEDLNSLLKVEYEVFRYSDIGRESNQLKSV